MEEEKPRRDPTKPCPDCRHVALYTDYYDKCYRCGRGIK